MSGPGWADLSADEILLQLRLNPGSVSGFLDTHQWSPLRNSDICYIAGGHDNAQLRVVTLERVPRVALWRIERSHLPADVANARQLRTYLYRNGVQDGQVGDIICGDHLALATFPDLDLTEYLPGVDTVDEWQEPELPLERLTVSALRLDAVVASLFRVSRAEAQTAVEYGFLFQNFEQVKKRTAVVAQDDQIVYRTKGRVEIVRCDATTKSGRIAVGFKRFPM
jgi:RNA-binding protein YlmH